MRNQILTFSFILVFSTLLIANNQISEFHATRQDNAVFLEWATESESGLKSFELHRSCDQSSWLKIGSVSAAGETTSKNYYSYVDNSVYKPTESSFYYQIVLVYKSGQKVTHDTVVSISGSSGIRHTWGSIKATFR
ncbi:hypothetical protein HQ585_21320 [candidate division KSB1 bacterium]|nr:hypothetical protein [candidate division KSB1 bacterium]